MKHNNNSHFGIELPRRLSRKQAHKWTGAKSTPRCLRHVGGLAARLREADLSGREAR